MSKSYLRSTYHQKVKNASEVDLVCIPDLPFKVGNIPWDSIDWEHFLPKIITVDVKAYIFDYDFAFTDPFNWNNLFEQCDHLFRELSTLNASHRGKPRPILFVCERLGGIIFKETLLRIQARSYEQRALANEISGVVFLATPHSIEEDEQGRRKFALILRRVYKEVRDSVFSKSDLTLLSLISQRFEEIPFDLPLLSVYESQPTRLLQSGIITIRKSAVVLVDHRYAKIDLPHVTHTCSDIHVSDLAKSPSYESRLHKDIASYLDKRARITVEQTSNTLDALSTTYAPSSFISRTDTEISSQAPMSPRPEDPFLSNGVTSPSSESARSHSRSSDGSIEVVSPFSALNITVKDIILPYRQISPHTQNEDFFPRLEITKAIEDHLVVDKRGRSGPDLKTYVLYGPAGHGKTELAVAFFFDHLNDFDVMIFLHGENADKLRHDIANCVVGLGLVDQSDALSNAMFCYQQLMSWLEYPVKKPALSQRSLGRQAKSPEAGEFAKVLLVIDNADDPELVLNSCWPKHGLCSILVTSQSPVAMSHQYFGTNGSEVGLLSEREGMDMLSQLTSEVPTCSRMDTKTMQDITSRLNGFPLAIAGASSMVVSEQLSLEDLRDWLYEENGYEDFVRQRIGGKIQRGYKHTNISAAVTSDLSDEMPRALLSVACFLDPDGVSESILVANIDAEALAGTNYPRNKSEFRKARTALLRRSIIKRNNEQRTLWFHRIPRDVTLALLKDKPDEMRKFFDIAVVLVRSQWPSSIGAAVGKWHEVKRWETCSKLYIQIRNILSAFKSNEATLSSMSSVKSLVELFADAGR